MQEEEAFQKFYFAKMVYGRTKAVNIRKKRALKVNRRKPRLDA